MANDNDPIMQAAKDAFSKIPPGPARNIFIHWARQEADKDLRNELNASAGAAWDDMKGEISKGRDKATELAKGVGDLLQKGVDDLDKAMKDFLGEDKDKK